MVELFSKRHGFNQTSEAEITIRQDAPHNLRGFVVQLAYECGLRPSILRNIVCFVLRERPDQNNWSEFPNIDGEIQTLVDSCIWYRVYDIVEQIAQFMSQTPYTYDSEKFSREINSFFIDTGIGWKLIDGLVEIRGTEIFENVTTQVVSILDESCFKTAKNEMHESLSDLARRPDPDVSGALHHAMAALECVSREICGERNATLGDLMKRNKNFVPRPLDEVVSKSWGYASEYARHVREGQTPTFDEAELVVGISAVMCIYLLRKNIIKR